MGDRIEASALAVGQGDDVQARLQRCVAALQRMIDGGWLVDHDDTVGMEVERDLVDPLGRPRLINDAVLARLGRTDMQHELGQFNIELNLDPEQSRLGEDAMIETNVVGPDVDRGAAGWRGSVVNVQAADAVVPGRTQADRSN